MLTPSGLNTHIFVSESVHHYFTYWLGIYSAPSHYRNRCWIIINCTQKNKRQWQFHQDAIICFTIYTLIHLSRVKHICVGNLTIIGSDNGLSPDRRQAITWTSVGLLLIAPLGTNFSEIVIKIHTFSFKKQPLFWLGPIVYKIWSAKYGTFRWGHNVLRVTDYLPRYANLEVDWPPFPPADLGPIAHQP